MAATRRSVSPALLLVGLAALACGEASPGGRPAPTGDAPLTPREWTEGEGFRWRELAIPPSGRAGFRALEPDRTGVAFENRLTEESLVENQMRTNGSGVALADVDGDGRVDIYLARLDGPNALYRNLGDWRFEDVTASAGVEAADRFSTGATFADVDGDGDPDLLLTALGGGVTLFVNDGRGAFEPRTDAGLESDAGSMSMALADIDGDGDLDLYVTNYKRASVLDLYPPEARDFASTVRRTDTGYEVVPEFAPHYELQWRGNEVRRLEKAEPDRLYRNLGDGRFQAVAFGEAFRDPEGVPVDPAPGEWGLAARFGDLDGDGDADLYVCNDLHSPDRLWLNDGQGGFREIDPLALRTTSASTMAVDFSDIERDGDVDIFTLDMWARSSRRQKTQDPVARVERALPGEVGGTQQVPHNALQVNRGDGTWAEIANQAGVEASGWSWSALFVDVDLDGFEDLLIPNGHIRDLMDADTQRRIRTTAPRDWRRNLLLFDPLPLVNVAFHNLGGRRFEEVGVAWGFGRDPDVSHGGALADLDGDGDLDVVVNRLGSPALLLRNETAAPRVAVRLRGRPPNTRGIGATISVRAAGLPEQTKELAAGGGYLSSSEPLAVFALGGAGGAEIEVRWPSGRHSRVRVEGPNRLIEVDESGADTLGAGAGAGPGPGADGAGAGADGAGSGASGAGSGASGAAPWFEPVGSFTALHDEPPFDDFARQPLLPMRLSQSGPALAWRDLDADGDPDLAIGQGAGSPPGLYRNDGGRLRRVTVPGPEAPVDQTGIAGLPGPRGGGRLALGWSSWEAPAADVSAVPGAVTFDVSPGSLAGATVVPAVRGLPGGEGSATGPLAAADVDGDGILDLFVGGRARPGRYPEPASSRLLRGTPSGDLQPDPVHDRLLDRLGLVSGATFADLDGDGDPDLVLALDWGGVRILANEGGRLTDATGRWGLSEATSRWNALVAGDLNADGRTDLVATSWGRNTEYRASPERPLVVYYEDMDRNGTVDVIEARRDERIGGIAPLVGFERLARAIPSVRERIRSHAEYADATVREVLGRVPSGRLEARGLAHTVFWNRGDRFEAEELPDEAQWAPALGAAVADADGDGLDDLFLAQNFFATDEDSPRYDAGRGLWLRGSRDERLEPVPARISGVRVYGDQRGVAVADFDGDGRVDLAVGQNGAAVRLFRNRGGRPGLRVRVAGPPGNPDGVGTGLRVVYADGRGPLREIRSGSGSGSVDGAVAVLGLAADPVALEVRWPGGRVEEVALAPGTREVRLGPPGGGDGG